MASEVRFSPEWNAVKLIFNALILTLSIRFWVIHQALSRVTIVVLLPSLYMHFEPSYGEQSQIFPKVNCRKINIRCTYIGLVGQIWGHPASPGHGLHNGTGSISVFAFWVELWWAKSIFPQSELQKNRYSIQLFWSDQSDFGSSTEFWPWAT